MTSCLLGALLLLTLAVYFWFLLRWNVWSWSEASSNEEKSITVKIWQQMLLKERAGSDGRLGADRIFQSSRNLHDKEKKKKTYCTSKMSDFNLDLMSFTEPVYIQEETWTSLQLWSWSYKQKWRFYFLNWRWGAVLTSRLRNKPSGSSDLSVDERSVWSFWSSLTFSETRPSTD